MAKAVPDLPSFSGRLDDADLLHVVDVSETDPQDRKVRADQLRLDLSVLPSGATASRPGSPVAGQLFWDSDLSKVIVYSGAAWVNADGSSL